MKSKYDNSIITASKAGCPSRTQGTFQAGSTNNLCPPGRALDQILVGDVPSCEASKRGGARGGLGGYSPPSEASSPPSEEILVLVGGNLAK